MRDSFSWADCGGALHGPGRAGEAPKAAPAPAGEQGKARAGQRGALTRPKGRYHTGCITIIVDALPSVNRSLVEFPILLRAIPARPPLRLYF